MITRLLVCLTQHTVGAEKHVVFEIKLTFTVVDPGFSRGSSVNSPEGAPTYDFAKFSPKLHENERSWSGGGQVSLAAPRSANGLLCTLALEGVHSIYIEKLVRT